MYVVLVQVTVRTELLGEFERVLLHNARESVAHDVGCLRFDVSQQVDDPTRWVLYEVYDAPESHAAHRQSPHFLAYDAFAREAGHALRDQALHVGVTGTLVARP